MGGKFNFMVLGDGRINGKEKGNMFVKKVNVIYIFKVLKINNDVGVVRV